MYLSSQGEIAIRGMNVVLPFRTQDLRGEGEHAECVVHRVGSREGNVVRTEERAHSGEISMRIAMAI